MIVFTEKVSRKGAKGKKRKVSSFAPLREKSS
jgi:hypothetical protein